jgi:hypothetical protein
MDEETPKDEPTSLPPPPLDSPAATEAATEGYVVTSWNGLPNYECSVCPYATLSEESILLHVLQQHIRPYRQPPDQPRPVIFDRFGNPVT